MATREFKNALADVPQASLLDAVRGDQDRLITLPLLDAELRRSSHRLQRLKEYRNAFASPAYRLQPELLSTLFIIYARDNNELFDLRWTKLLLVCRRWYERVGPSLEASSEDG